MTAINITILIGAIQGYLLSFLLLTKKNVFHSKLFAFILFCIGTALLLAYLQLVLDINDYPFLIKSSSPFALLFIPGLLIYLKFLTSSHPKGKPFWLIFFSPFVFLILVNLPFYFSDKALKIDYFIRNEINNQPNLIEKFEDVFIDFFAAFFSLLAVFEAQRYSKRIKLLYSNLEETKVGWVFFLAYSMFILSSVALVLSLGKLFFDEVPVSLNFITAMGSTVVIYGIACFLLAYPGVFFDISIAMKSIDADADPSKSTNKESKELSYGEFEQKIIGSLENDRLFLDPEITLAKFSNKVGIPPYLASKIINQNLDTNFFSLINKYRLEHAKRELLSQNNKSIIEVAYQSGFNSKTSFYESFKKDVGVSPSEFIKNNQIPPISN